MRNERLQTVLETVVHNGLKASWASLGHGEDGGQVLSLLQANKETRIPGQVTQMDQPPAMEVTNSNA